MNFGHIFSADHALSNARSRLLQLDQTFGSNKAIGIVNFYQLMQEN